MDKGLLNSFLFLFTFSLLSLPGLMSFNKVSIEKVQVLYPEGNRKIASQLKPLKKGECELKQRWRWTCEGSEVVQKANCKRDRLERYSICRVQN